MFSAVDPAAVSANRRESVAGVVTHGQHPESAKGAVFVNLKGKTGMVDVICLEITTDVHWRGVWLDAPSTRSQLSRAQGYPVLRATMIQLSGTVALLWGAGDAPEVSAGAHFYQGQ